MWLWNSMKNLGTTDLSRSTSLINIDLFNDSLTFGGGLKIIMIKHIGAVDLGGRGFKYPVTLPPQISMYMLIKRKRQ